MKRDKRGFTLAELLVVVAIIAVLVAIAIPIFTNQLEKSREATDAANIRSQYAQVMTDAITEGGNVNGKDVYGTIDLKQKKDNWQDETLGNNLHGLFQEVEGHPVANGTAWVEYNASDSKAILHYEGEGSGTDTGGSSSGGSTGGNGGSSSGTGGNTSSSTSFTCPDFKINNVIPHETDPKKGFTVTNGNVYSYNGNYYVCIADRTVGNNWDEKTFNDSLPHGNAWPYVQLNSSPYVVTDSDIIKDQYNNTPHFVNLAIGTIYKDSEGKLYIIKFDSLNGNWIQLPSSNTNWQLINQ